MFFWQRRFDKKGSLEYQKEVQSSPVFPGQAPVFLDFETPRVLRGWYYIKAAHIESGGANIKLFPFTTTEFPYEWVGVDIRQVSEVCFDPEIFKNPTKYVARLHAGKGSKIFVRCAKDKEVWEKELRYETFGSTESGGGFLGAKAVSQLENPHDVELPC